MTKTRVCEIDGKRYRIEANWPVYCHIYRLKKNGECGYRLNTNGSIYLRVFNHYRELMR
jgi:hypothetical protein